MRPGESYQVSNQNAATFGPYALQGGAYQLSAKGTWGGGSLILQTLLPDNTTWITLWGKPQTSATPNTAVGSLTADGVLLFEALPPGQFQLVYATGTALYAALTRVPHE